MTTHQKLRSARDVLRKDPGIETEAHCLEQLGWMVFMKIMEDRDSENEGLDPDHRSPIPKRFRWGTWARGGLADDDLIAFLNNELFPRLRALPVEHGRDRRGAVVRSVFEDSENHVAQGGLLRKAIAELDALDFSRAADPSEIAEQVEAFEDFARNLSHSTDDGELYTPRALTHFVVDRVDPRIGESVLDPACGTGGFLIAALDHAHAHHVGSAIDEAILQRSLYGVEKRPLSHLLCVDNLMINGVDVPAQVRCDNALSRPLVTYRDDELHDVVVSCPPFRELEEMSVTSIFPPEIRTRESADLLLYVVMHLLKPGGRAGIVVSDGALRGEGVKETLRRKLLEEHDLHTVVRLPRGVMSPQTDARANLLFFTKGRPTEEIWFYEHVHPELWESYTTDDPLEPEHLEPIREWWDDRRPGAGAWKVSAREVAAAGYRLDLEPPETRQLKERPKPAVVEAVPLEETNGSGELSFFDLELEDRVAEVYDILFALGPVTRDEAIRVSAEALRGAGLADFARLRRDGRLASALEETLDAALDDGYLDRPRNGHVRAVLPDAKDYTPDDWFVCLLQSLGPEPVERDRAVRDAADWAAEHLGLEFRRLRRDGVIYSGLEAAIDEAIERGEVEAQPGGDGLYVYLPEAE